MKNVSVSSDYLLDGTHSVDEQIQKLKIKSNLAPKLNNKEICSEERKL